jgi:hypothetical protein
MTIYSNPESWGPPAWVFLHCISLTYPKKPSMEEQMRYKTFFESLVHVLPCPSCRLEYKKWLKNHPIDPHLKSRSLLTDWVIALHNSINFRNQKTTVPTKKVALEKIRQDCRKYDMIAQSMNRPKK